jgi:hypothetical protein
MEQVVEHLPSKHRSQLQTQNHQKKKELQQKYMYGLDCWRFFFSF